MTNKAWYSMSIVCWQTILMKYHTLFLSKVRKDVMKFLLSAAVVIGALRFNYLLKLILLSTTYIYIFTLAFNESLDSFNCS